MAASIFVGWFASFAILFTGHNKASRRSIYTDSRNGLFVRKRGREGGGGIFLKAVDNVSVMRSIDRKWFSSKCDDSFKTGFFFYGAVFFFSLSFVLCGTTQQSHCFSLFLRCYTFPGFALSLASEELSIRKCDGRSDGTERRTGGKRQNRQKRRDSLLDVSGRWWR